MTTTNASKARHTTTYGNLCGFPRSVAMIDGINHVHRGSLYKPTLWTDLCQ